jgi:hypothetical protein
MPAPTYLLVAGFKDAPKAPERDYDPDLDGDAPPEDDKPIPKKRGRTRTTNVSRAGIRIGTDDEGQPLSQGGFRNPVKRRVERMRSTSGFTPAEEQELKQGFAAIQGLMTGQPVDVSGPDEPTDEEIELAFTRHEFQGGPRTQYCRMTGCFKARGDKVHG